MAFELLIFEDNLPTFYPGYKTWISFIDFNCLSRK